MDDDDRDAVITEQRLAGRAVATIAKQFGCSRAEVEAALDRRLGGEIDNVMRLKAIRLDVGRLDRLFQAFYTRALGECDVPSGVLCVKILERRSLLLGLDQPTKFDIIQVQAQQAPSSYSQIKAAVMALKYNGQEPSDGNGLDGNGSDDPASDTALLDDTKPSR